MYQPLPNTARPWWFVIPFALVVAALIAGVVAIAFHFLRSRAPIDTNLEGAHLANLRIVEPVGSLCAGGRTPVVLEATVERKGKSSVLRTTPNEERERIAPGEFAFTTTGGVIDGGEWFLPDPDMWVTAVRKFDLSVSFRRDADVRAAGSYAPSYDCVKEVVEHGADASVLASIVSTPFHEYLLAIRFAHKDESGMPRHLLAPANRPFVIDVSGAPGSNGMDASSCDSDGRPGGSGGRGGHVTVEIDERFPDIGQLLQLKVQGGPGGSGGRPYTPSMSERDAGRSCHGHAGPPGERGMDGGYDITHGRNGGGFPSFAAPGSSGATSAPSDTAPAPSASASAARGR